MTLHSSRAPDEPDLIRNVPHNQSVVAVELDHCSDAGESFFAFAEHPGRKRPVRALADVEIENGAAIEEGDGVGNS